MSIIPLRIVPRDDSLSDWLFGGLIDDPRIQEGDCKTVMVLSLQDEHLLYFALTADFDWVCDHSDHPNYTDWKSVVVERITFEQVSEAGDAFHPKVSMMRLPTVDELDVTDEGFYDIHKIGGVSYWSHCESKVDSSLVAQLAFPDREDLPLDLDWPTGEMTIELHQDSSRDAYFALWRMHA